MLTMVSKFHLTLNNNLIFEIAMCTQSPRYLKESVCRQQETPNTSTHASALTALSRSMLPSYSLQIPNSILNAFEKEMPTTLSSVVVAIHITNSEHAKQRSCKWSLHLPGYSQRLDAVCRIYPYDRRPHDNKTHVHVSQSKCGFIILHKRVSSSVSFSTKYFWLKLARHVFSDLDSSNPHQRVSIFGYNNVKFLTRGCIPCANAPRMTE